MFPEHEAKAIEQISRAKLVAADLTCAIIVCAGFEAMYEFTYALRRADLARAFGIWSARFQHVAENCVRFDHLGQWWVLSQLQGATR